MCKSQCRVKEFINGFRPETLTPSAGGGGKGSPSSPGKKIMVLDQKLLVFIAA